MSTQPNAGPGQPPGSDPYNPFPINTNMPVTGSSFTDQSPFGLNAGLYYPYAPDVMNQNWPQQGGYSSPTPMPQPWQPWPPPGQGQPPGGQPPGQPPGGGPLGSGSAVFPGGGDMTGLTAAQGLMGAMQARRAADPNVIARKAASAERGWDFMQRRLARGESPTGTMLWKPNETSDPSTWSQATRDKYNKYATSQGGSAVTADSTWESLGAGAPVPLSQRPGLGGVNFDASGNPTGQYGAGNNYGSGNGGGSFQAGSGGTGGGALGNVGGFTQQQPNMPGFPNVPTQLPTGGMGQTPPWFDPYSYGGGPQGGRNFVPPGQPWTNQGGVNQHMPSSAVTPSVEAQYWASMGLPVYGRVPLGANISPHMVDAVYGYGNKLTNQGGKVAGQRNINRYTGSQPGVSEGGNYF